MAPKAKKGASPQDDDLFTPIDQGVAAEPLAEQVEDSPDARANLAKIKSVRNVPDPDMKTLWAKASGHCAHPECRARKELLLEPTEAGDGNAVIGEMAHITAYSENGPRGDANLSDDQRNLYQNLILLCPDHHRRVDKQPNCVPSSLLQTWKEEWERIAAHAIRSTVQNVPPQELKHVGDYIVERLSNHPTPDVGPLSLPTGINEKLNKNSLSDEVRQQVAVSQSRHGDVQIFIETQEKLLPAYPERLREGLLQEYNRLHTDGFRGDALYYSMRDFAAGNSQSDLRRGAACIILAYFFVVCEVFEP